MKPPNTANISWTVRSFLNGIFVWLWTPNADRAWLASQKEQYLPGRLRGPEATPYPHPPQNTHTHSNVHKRLAFKASALRLCLT